MSDKKITELPLASAVNASDVSVLVNNGTDYQFAFSSLLQLIGSSLTVGANISFGTTLPQNTAGKNGDVFINTSTATFAQKISGAWTVVYTLPVSGGTTDGTVLYGIGVPSPLTGNNNDTYINTGTGVFYKKSSGTWSQVFSMQTGPAGAPGSPGANGTNGTNGFSILSGTTNPSNIGTGVNGDFYINTTTYILFGPKSAGVWGSGVSLIGNGVPIGGTTSQVMSKVSDDDFDIEWTDKFAGLNEDIITDALGYTPEDANNKGSANGYASLDGSGKVPSSQLPSYVDDVIEVVNLSSLPASGETGKIYITLDTNFEYRWSGSTYIRLVASPGSTDALTEGTTNLYFTVDRARNTNSATSPIFYNTNTGVISSQAATSVQNGYLSSADWTNFNNKQTALLGTGLVKSTAGVISYDTNNYNSGSGTAGYITKYSAANTQTQTAAPIYETQGRIGIGHITPASGTLVHISSGSAMPLRISTTAADVAQFIANNNYGGFRVATVGSGGPGAGVPYIALATGAAADGSSLGTQRAYFAYNQNVANTASLGYGSGTDAIVWITSGTGVGNVLIGSAINNTASNKLQVTGSVGITSLTASQPVFTDANKTLVSMAVIPAANGGAGNINGLLKANGSGMVSQALVGVDYLEPSALSGYLPLTAGSGNPLTDTLFGTNINLAGGIDASSGQISAFRVVSSYFIPTGNIGSAGGTYIGGHTNGNAITISAGNEYEAVGTIYLSAVGGFLEAQSTMSLSSDKGVVIGGADITTNADRISPMLTFAQSEDVEDEEWHFSNNWRFRNDQPNYGYFSLQMANYGSTVFGDILTFTPYGHRAKFINQVEAKVFIPTGDYGAAGGKYIGGSDSTIDILVPGNTENGSINLYSYDMGGSSSGSISIRSGYETQGAYLGIHPLYFSRDSGIGKEDSRMWRILIDPANEYGSFALQQATSQALPPTFADVLKFDKNKNAAFSGNITASTSFIAKSPDGTIYKLTPPNGGGAATWVAV
ncbi:hypothetical protein GCM10027049_21970 [Mucilaginibacter puniceus]